MNHFPGTQPSVAPATCFPIRSLKKPLSGYLKLCVDNGMVSGHTQAIDSAYIKANASLDSLEKKTPAENLKDTHSKNTR